MPKGTNGQRRPGDVIGPTKVAPGRYSTAECTLAKPPIEGRPDEKHISTSYVERANPTMRMSMRRFTRLTNAFSKKLDNHMQALALYFAFYNFPRIYKTLRFTPAMTAGITDRLWRMEDIANLIEARAPKAAVGVRGPAWTLEKEIGKLRHYPLAAGEDNVESYSR